MNDMNDMENESISKGLEAALKSFESKTKQVPVGYFDQFEHDIMQKIKEEEQAPQKTRIITLFSNQKKYLVAASLVLAIATGYLFFNKVENTNDSIVKVETIDIETLPDELIEAYVNNNELVAEVEWNSAIESTGTNLTLTNN
jgi:predicted house-cleaning NTP pyrophosphatase (Maf/HAM1 superfamily)